MKYKIGFYFLLSIMVAQFLINGVKDFVEKERMKNEYYMSVIYGYEYDEELGRWVK